MTGTTTPQNIDISSWITLYIHTEMCHLFESLEALSSTTEGCKVHNDEHKLPTKILILAIHTTLPGHSNDGNRRSAWCQAALVDNPRVVWRSNQRAISNTWHGRKLRDCWALSARLGIQNCETGNTLPETLATQHTALQHPTLTPAVSVSRNKRYYRRHFPPCLNINKCVTAVILSNFSRNYLRNRSTSDIGVFD